MRKEGGMKGGREGGRECAPFPLPPKHRPSPPYLPTSLPPSLPPYLEVLPGIFKVPFHHEGKERLAPVPIRYSGQALELRE